MSSQPGARNCGIEALCGAKRERKGEGVPADRLVEDRFPYRLRQADYRKKKRESATADQLAGDQAADQSKHVSYRKLSTDNGDEQDERLTGTDQEAERQRV